MKELTEEERKALRGSKFAPLPSAPTQSRSQPRLAHPGGPLKTNKAAALAKFLERKLQDPTALASINPQLVELAVKNAKDTIKASGSLSSSSGRLIQHVNSFGDTEDSVEVEKTKDFKSLKPKKNKKKKSKKNKNKKQIMEGAL